MDSEPYLKSKTTETDNSIDILINQFGLLKISNEPTIKPKTSAKRQLEDNFVAYQIQQSKKVKFD